MTRTADRLDLVLRVLADRPGITAAELARTLGISPRGVFRAVAALRDRGYPVEASRGRGGGMRLHPNWGLSRVLLSVEEALGTLLSLAIAEQFALPMFAPELARARRRIVAAFPAAERRRLTPLRERILVGPPASRAVRESWRPPDPPVTRPLQAAFVRDRMVTIGYVRGNGEQSVRRMEPHAMLLNWPAWYLAGFDHLRGEARVFRLDRIVSVREEPEMFRPNPVGIIEQIGGLQPDSVRDWRL